MKDKKIIKMMIGFTHIIKRFFLFAIIASTASSLMNFITPLIVGFTVDSVIGDKAAAMPGPIMRF